MVREHHSTRRSYLKYAGTAGAGVALTGCLGGGDGDGTDGSDGDGTGGTKLVATGDFERVFNYRDAWIDAVGNPFSQIEIAAYQETIDENPDAFRKFFRAFHDASAHVMDNIDSVFETYADTVGLNPDEVEPFAAYVKNIDGYVREYSEDVVAGDKALARQAGELGILEAEPDVDEMWVDPRTL